MSKTASFLAGCATIGVATILFGSGNLQGSNPHPMQPPMPQGSVVPQPSVSLSPPPTPTSPTTSGREWERVLEEFEEQQEVTEELYSRLDEQRSVTEELAEQLEEQGDGLKEQRESTDEIVDLFEEQNSNTQQIVGMFEEQRSQTDQIEALVAEQQHLLESMGESANQQGQAEPNSFQWVSIPLFVTVTVALIVIVVLIGIVVLLIIALLMQARKRPRAVHRAYHMPPRLVLPTQDDDLPQNTVPPPFYPNYPEVYYHDSGSRIRRVTPNGDR